MKNKLAKCSQCLFHFLSSLTKGRLKTFRRFWYGQKSLGLFFFPSIVKLLFIWNATTLFLLVFHCWFPPILIVFFIFEYGECPNHSISQNYTASSQKYQLLPTSPPCTVFPTYSGGDHPQLLLLRCYVMSDSFATPWTTALQDRLCPWDFPGKNIGVGCHFLLQGMLLTQGSNSGVLHSW